MGPEAKNIQPLSVLSSPVSLYPPKVSKIYDSRGSKLRNRLLPLRQKNARIYPSDTRKLNAYSPDTEGNSKSNYNLDPYQPQGKTSSYSQATNFLDTNPHFYIFLSALWMLFGATLLRSFLKRRKVTSTTSNLMKGKGSLFSLQQERVNLLSFATVKPSFAALAIEGKDENQKLEEPLSTKPDLSTKPELGNAKLIGVSIPANFEAFSQNIRNSIDDFFGSGDEDGINVTDENDAEKRMSDIGGSFVQGVKASFDEAFGSQDEEMSTLANAANPVSLGRSVRQSFDEISDVVMSIASPMKQTGRTSPITANTFDQDIYDEALVSGDFDDFDLYELPQAAYTTVLVTGATGRVGKVVVRKLLLRGYKVRALIRSEADRESLPEIVETVVGDVGDISAMRTAVAGTSKIIYCARSRSTLTADLYNVDVLGVQNACKAMQDHHHTLASRRGVKSNKSKHMLTNFKWKSTYDIWKPELSVQGVIVYACIF